jgi:prophage regulatory protein
MLTDEEIEGLRLIDKNELLKIVPLSESTITRLEKKGEFPKRLLIGARRVAWRLRAVRSWIDRCDVVNGGDFERARLIPPPAPKTEPMKFVMRSVSQTKTRETVRITRVRILSTPDLGASYASNFDPLLDETKLLNRVGRVKGVAR